MKQRKRIVTGFWIVVYLIYFVVLPALPFTYGTWLQWLATMPFVVIVATIWWLGIRHLAQPTMVPQTPQAKTLQRRDRRAAELLLGLYFADFLKTLIAQVLGNGVLSEAIKWVLFIALILWFVKAVRADAKHRDSTPWHSEP